MTAPHSPSGPRQPSSDPQAATEQSNPSGWEAPAAGPATGHEDGDHTHTQHYSTTPLSSNITITPVTAPTLPAFRRLLKLLLPIPYKDEFFSEILSDPEVGSLARIALWRDDIPKKRQKDDEDEHAAAIDTDLVQPTSAEEDRSTVVGGVRCRLEPVPCPPDVDDPVQKHQLYIQTLAVLSPYSGQGIATHLLEQVLVNALHNHFVTSVYAHVWECNEEGLEWYKRRGFKVEAQMLHGYYQRLRPAGAWVLRRVVGVSDHLKVNNRDVVN